MAAMPRLPLLALTASLVLAASLAAGVPATGPAREPLEPQGRPVLGASSAPVTVIEVASFKCTHCRDFHERVFPTLKTEYVETGKVRWIVLNASDDPSQQFVPVFAAARCALAQGKYWDVLDLLFQAAPRPPGVLTELLARSPLLEPETFGLCLHDRATRLAVAADFSAYTRLKIRGTPSFVFFRQEADGGRTETVLAGAQTLPQFREVLDALLRRP